LIGSAQSWPIVSEMLPHGNWVTTELGGGAGGGAGAGGAGHACPGDTQVVPPEHADWPAPHVIVPLHTDPPDVQWPPQLNWPLAQTTPATHCWDDGE
jgi:hypothetical protein